MTVKQLIKMVEENNKLATILERDKLVVDFVSILHNGLSFIAWQDVSTLKEFDKLVKDFCVNKNIKDCEVVQNQDCSNCFDFTIDGDDFLIMIDNGI